MTPFLTLKRIIVMSNDFTPSTLRRKTLVALNELNNDLTRRCERNGLSTTLLSTLNEPILTAISKSFAFISLDDDVKWRQEVTIQHGGRRITATLKILDDADNLTRNLEYTLR